MIFVGKDIIVIFRKSKSILIFISFKRYFSHTEKSILNLSIHSLTLRRHCNSGRSSSEECSTVLACVSMNHFKYIVDGLGCHYGLVCLLDQGAAKVLYHMTSRLGVK